MNLFLNLKARSFAKNFKQSFSRKRKSFNQIAEWNLKEIDKEIQRIEQNFASNITLLLKFKLA